MAAPNLFVLTNATRFQPVRLRSHSRSPSRSPLRKSQFAARELDPLLSNLSPDSTLKALQATSTITSGGKEQDALAKSIAEASPAEREIGIRAAVAAQKLKEWHKEVSQWPWPARRDRGWGAGFLPPQRPAHLTNTPESVPHLGFLPTVRIEEFQDRIEDIRDGIEALELEDVKDHVFSAHVPQRSVSAPNSLPSSSTESTGYGRMRDFTALITATVIQALPELANLTVLLDTWDVRLSVLRQIPDVTHSFKSTRAGVQTAFSVVRNVDTGPLVTMTEYETTKRILGAKVASLGTKIDKLLDTLEGQEDSLPKSWIDTLESIEEEYAAWVVEAEHIVIRNDLLSRALADQSKSDQSEAKAILGAQTIPGKKPLPITTLQSSANQDGAADDVEVGTPVAELPSSSLFSRAVPTLEAPDASEGAKKVSFVTSPPASRHNRGVSDISLADSTYSAMSDISAAEIVDAKQTQVLTSPRISVVENPFRGSRDELSWFNKPSLDVPQNTRPSMLQRASTASIEVVSRNSIRQVTLTRSRSHDLLNQISSLQPHPSDPSQALRQLTGDMRKQTPSPDEFRSDSESVQRFDSLAVPVAESATISPSPSLRVEPLQIRARLVEDPNFDGPDLPRRSSKRLSQNLGMDTMQSTVSSEPRTPVEASTPENQVITPARPTTSNLDESLEAKIKDILSAMPTKIRLAKEADNDEAQQASSTASTRSSTPVPSLTLSPAKPDRTGRQITPGDVRVFHLTRSGQSRDAPPVKLFVRAVGEHGERVMVRVGGGWADLAEYLREYSLHHGHRGLANDNLEVANFPTSPASRKDGSPSASATSVAAQPKFSAMSTQPSAKRRSFPSALPGSGDLPPLTVAKSRRNNRGHLSGSSNSPSNDSWIPPPVPPIPATYTMQMPTTVTTTTNGVTNTATLEPLDPNLRNSRRIVSSPVISSISNGGRMMSTSTTTSSPPAGAAKYTPLGAAGPKSNGRRAVTHSTSPGPERDLWVEDMVGKARAISGGTTTFQGPTTTTTTTVISRPTPTPTPTPKSNRVSAVPSMSPASSPGAASPVNLVSKPNASPPPRPKSRLSFGDVSGIKRVFLRRKSEKGLEA